VAVFKAYNLFTLNRVKFLIADAGGAANIPITYITRLKNAPK